MEKIANKPKKYDMKNMAEMLKASAHPDRLAILSLLCKANGGLTVKSIYEKLSLQQPVVSRHLNILRNAGVVRRLREGQKIYYCLCNEKKAVESLSKCFC
ncbi:MAG TPA: metalloregulator ArsR/SmtB family transcription factor [Chitinophagaceae bacterium]|nr:metalloregulator ArsR/SmtB family transcription factor [Chitinophagaceae bacterium]